MIKVRRATVQSVIKNFTSPDTTFNKPLSGCPLKLNARDVRTVICKVQSISKIDAPK